MRVESLAVLVLLVATIAVLSPYFLSVSNFLNILLCEIPESIDWPAQVTLAGSLTGVAGFDGITVNAAGVSIDLAGHTTYFDRDVS